MNKEKIKQQIHEFKLNRLKYLDEKQKLHPEEKPARARQIMECDYVCGKIMELIDKNEHE